MDRYSRHIALKEIGQEGQAKLAEAKVLVIGAGGLGCPVLQYLTAAGVGTLGVIDFDIVEESNLQRQVLFGTSSLGRNKAIAARERLHDLNPTIKINTYPERLTVANAPSLFEEYDIVADGSDNFETRYLADDFSLLTKRPLVFGAIYKFEGQVSVFNYQNGPSYRCLFPNIPGKDDMPNCSEVGVLGVLPGIIGTMQANEVLKIILGLGDVLSGKLWCFDALSSTSHSFKVKRNESEIQKILSGGIRTTSDPIDTLVKEVSLSEAFEMPGLQLVDVREPGEQPVLNHPDILHIPLSSLSTKPEGLAKNQTVVFFCQQGLRSIQAVKIGTQQGLDNCFSLKEGAVELNNYLEAISHEN